MSEVTDKKKKKLGLYQIALIELIILVIVWQVLAELKVIPGYLSEPLEIGKEMWAMITSGELLENSLVSLYRSFAGFFLVVIVGIILGIIAGYVKKIGDFIDPVISILNPVPKVAFLPMFIVWFGVSDTTRILLIFATAFFPAFIATFDGVRSVNKLLIWASKNMGASHLQILRKVIFPASLSKIFDGLRIALAISFVMMFSSEMIGSSNGLGLGFIILKADVYGRISVMFAAIITIAVLGALADFILQMIRKRVLWWAER